MGTAFVECWKCEECGFRWIKTEVWPERCASSKCRKRSWNKGGKPDAQIAVETEAVMVEAVTAFEEPPATMNGAMERFLASSKASTARVVPKEVLGPMMPEPVLLAEGAPLCRHREFCEQDGETYHCALNAGHKGKCVRGEQV